MTGRIDCYLDIASFYSYIAFVQILENRELLAKNSIEVELHPVLIGAINVGSENKPPWTVPAKATYGRYDMRRAAESVGLKDVSPPGDLMEAGKTMLPLRALIYIKTAYPAPTFLTAFHYLLHAFWTLRRPPNTRDVLEAVLLEIPSSFPSPSSPLFTSKDVSRILAAASSPPLKDALKHSVDEALARGAFGAPWLWVTRRGEEGKGESEPFFGSDRWHFVYEFLGVPYQGVELWHPDRRDRGFETGLNFSKEERNRGKRGLCMLLAC